MTIKLEANHLKTISILFAYFCILALAFYYLKPGYLIWPILILSAVAWLFIEFKKSKNNLKILKKALTLGIFLMLFDFIVENIGAYLNLWTAVQTTIFHVIAVPIEVMLVCIIGGAAWAMAQPKKPMLSNEFLDIIFFAFFGALGEYTLIQNNAMQYFTFWNSILAFTGYIITWAILHLAWHKIFSKQ